MSALEREEENKVVQWWERRGGLQAKMNLWGRRGFPDRVFFPAGGKPIFIEFKRVGEEPEPIQLYYHEELRKRGYEVHVCDNADDGKTILASASVL